jgi:hypothetical protein
MEETRTPDAPRLTREESERIFPGRMWAYARRAAEHGWDIAIRPTERGWALYLTEDHHCVHVFWEPSTGPRAVQHPWNLAKKSWGTRCPAKVKVTGQTLGDFLEHHPEECAGSHDRNVLPLLYMPHCQDHLCPRTAPENKGGLGTPEHQRRLDAAVLELVKRYGDEREAIAGAHAVAGPLEVEEHKAQAGTWLLAIATALVDARGVEGPRYSLAEILGAVRAVAYGEDWRDFDGDDFTQAVRLRLDREGRGVVKRWPQIDDPAPDVAAVADNRGAVWRRQGEDGQFWVGPGGVSWAWHKLRSWSELREHRDEEHVPFP